MGLGEVRLRGSLLRSEALPWKVILYRLDGVEHKECLLEGANASGGTLSRLSFKDAEGGTDRVLWRVSFVKERLCEGEFSGLRSEFRGLSRSPVLKVLEAFSLDLGGRATGLRVSRGQLGPEDWLLPGVPRWGQAPFFEFVERQGLGALICYLERPALVRSALFKPPLHGNFNPRRGFCSSRGGEAGHSGRL
ncbi:MAG TPA: hypothetical protein EYP65_04915 [Armatimonadetes bacterium]|nr:hypothetical protein [Armatimonadota bacterium]